MNHDSHRMAGMKRTHSSITWLGATIAIIGVALLLAGIRMAVPSARVNTARCLEAYAHDQNRSVEGLLRDTALHASLIEATTLCSQ
ncbi:hypothetical protein [Caballeronia sordidicola]|uniref:hypothetical protein n=1 Tax=Caballeronia sordidicola TaxID=196367 RepID=UPI0015C503D9|nr:hypothetical protein [Caballeronia sordidicola]